MKEIKDLIEYTELVDDVKQTHGVDLMLFRGQSKDYPLLPGIARTKEKITAETEKTMLAEFKRKLPNYYTGVFKNDWDLLAIAQHHCMATRLLDWTQNPLIALWFACNGPINDGEFSVISIIFTNTSNIFKIENDDKTEDEEKSSPFKITSSKVISPNWIAKRIVNQSGLFTIHCPKEKEIDGSYEFQELNEDEKFKGSLRQFKINKENRTNIINELNIYGINHSTVFPDLDGLCKSINWNHLKL